MRNLESKHNHWVNIRNTFVVQQQKIQEKQQQQPQIYLYEE